MDNAFCLKALYDKKDKFKLGSLNQAILLASTDALEAEPDDEGEKRDYIFENFLFVTKAFRELIALTKHSAELQDRVLEISRYSSFLDQTVSLRKSRESKRVSSARSKLNSIRNLFVESLVNGDMETLKITNVINSMFLELECLEDFLSRFNEYVISINHPIADGISDSSKILEDYLNALTDAEPGMITLVTAMEPEGEIIDLTTRLIERTVNQEKNYRINETEHTTLCWTLGRSYIETPDRILRRAGIRPIERIDHLLNMIEVATVLELDDYAAEGLNRLVKWTTTVTNQVILALNTMILFNRVISATFECIWEHFFFQMNYLEETGDIASLKNVLEICHNTAFKDLGK